MLAKGKVYRGMKIKQHLRTSSVASLTISPVVQIFPCSLTVKQSISKKMNNDYTLKFA